MTVFVVLALLASNIILAKILLSRDSNKTNGPSAPTGKENGQELAEDAPQKDTIDEKIALVVGASNYDPDTYRVMLKEVVKEVVPLIIEEYGNYADAGLPEPPAEKKDPKVPTDKLDEVFSNKTVADITGEEPEPAEPRADGMDFNDMNTTMNVLRDKSNNAEDLAIAQRTLQELDGTAIKDAISLDPAIRKRIMLIELHLPKCNDGESIEADSDQPEKQITGSDKTKKILFHADIDTSDIDSIDFNVFH